jgi:two-component system sensor histidine kinase TrcS
MTSLVDELLLLSRLGEGEDLDTEDVDLSDLVLTAVNDAAVAAPTHRWVTQLPEGPVWVHGDRDRLHQLMSNLLNNARVHTPPGVTVTTGIVENGSGPDPPYAELTVADNGPGIEPALLPHLFERFVRADKSRSGETGTGLGLAIVASIVRAHHGYVTGESADGHTVFRVRIPTVEAPATAVAGTIPDAPAASKTPPQRR